MANDRVQRVTKYIADLKQRLVSDVSPRHTSNPTGIKEWLRREIRKHEMILEKLTK